MQLRVAEALGLQLQPDLVILDFEVAAHQALRQVIAANLTLVSCFFHKRESTWRKIQDLQLVERYAIK